MARGFSSFLIPFSVLLLQHLHVALSDTPANCTYEDIVGKWALHLGKGGFDNTLKCNGSFEVASTLVVDLLFPDTAVDSEGHKGFWTLIYNQGFELVINNRKYFAFSAYKTNGSTVTSLCHQTLNGWSHNAEEPKKDWSCYFGDKVTDIPAPKVKKVAQLPESVKNRPYRANKDFINKINNAQNSWTAGVYEDYEMFTLGQLTARSGAPASTFEFPSTRKATEEMHEAVLTIPEEFDWRNVSGVNFVSPVRNQAMCGSCYAFATMAMMEARTRIQTKNEHKPVFSTQDIVSCSEYSQGCDGGFPYLISKYGEDFGYVTEDCFPYDGKDEPCKEKQCPRMEAAGYHYVGGFYGACNEILMMLELVQNGPVAIGMMVYPDFMHYKGGIYHHTGLEDGFNPFEITNHAVLVVGYGVDKASQEKFWIVKNSWGEGWGEQGFFRVRRGTDEVAVESLAVAAHPVIS